MTERTEQSVVLSPGARAVLIGAAVWQFISWIGRIGLLTDPETADWWTWFRIGGSLLVGVGVLAVGLGIVRRWGIARLLAWAYLVVALLTWSRSLLNVWTEPNSLGFRIVHTGLALVTWSFALGSVWVTRPVADRRATVGS